MRRTSKLRDLVNKRLDEPPRRTPVMILARAAACRKTCAARRAVKTIVSLEEQLWIDDHFFPIPMPTMYSIFRERGLL